ncbi:MAG: HlyD family efflux transporter periplasmic adaptor subunit [Planctomycetota bacterium]|nr:HlyD family efflux transporter periplasmic adaptor subunit [Planctomycetota bacterium]
MLRILTQILIAASLLAAGGYGALLVVQGRPTAPERALPGPRPVPVESSEVRRGPVPRNIELQGTLAASRRFLVASEAGGRLAELYPGLRPGQLIPEGTLLLRVASEDLELQIEAQGTAIALATVRAEAAEAELARAGASLSLAEESLTLLRSEEARWKALVEGSGVEQARYDLARKQSLAAAGSVEEARARVEAGAASVTGAGLEVELGGEELTLLESRLARCAVRAPFDGRFVPLVSGGTPPEIGQVLAPGAPVGALVDVARLRLVAEVHEDDVAALALGAPASAAPLSRPGLVLEGRITAIGAEVRQITRSVVVEALFEGAVGLPSGTACAVTLRGAPLNEAIWLEERSIAYRSGGPVAYVLVEAYPEGTSRVEERRLVLAPGAYGGGRVVRAGLEAGVRVVSSSVQLVGDGALVRPIAAGGAEVPVEAPAPLQGGDQ